MLLSAVCGAHANFTFHGENKFNYSFPGNWSYVPCEGGYGGKETCDALTGSLGAVCSKSKFGGFKCHCTSFNGLITQGCADRFHPECVSGLHACQDRTAIAYFQIAIHTVIILWAVVSLCEAIKTFSTVAQKEGVYAVAFSTMAFVTSAIFSLIIWMISQGIAPATKNVVLSYQMMNPAISAFSFCAISALFNACAAWMIAVNAARKCDLARKRKNIGLFQFFILGVSGVLCSSALAYLNISGQYGIASLCSVGIIFVLGVYFLSGGRALVATIRGIPACKKMHHLLRSTLSFQGRAMLMYSFFATLYGLPMLPHRVAENMTMLSSAFSNLLVSGMYICLLLMQRNMTAFFGGKYRSLPSGKEKTFVAKIKAMMSTAFSSNPSEVTPVTVISSEHGE